MADRIDTPRFSCSVSVDQRRRQLEALTLPP